MASGTKDVQSAPCTLLLHPGVVTETASVQNLRRQIEEGNEQQKRDAVKATILLLLQGESVPQMLMPIIRFAMPSKDRVLKKLLLLFWEVVDKKTADGKLLHEMILVCNALMKDLNHPNEYIRGSTLRLVCKLKEPELLEPLIESIRLCLDHRHAYVRRNAVLAIYSIAKDFPHLIPDAADLIHAFLQQEGDASCKRNAFLMLFNLATPVALQYLSSVADSVAGFGEMQQLVVLEMIRRAARSQPQRRLHFMRIIFTLLGGKGTSAAVQYEAAVTLLSLSRAPTAVKAAASSLLSLLHGASDNNVKMIVLDKLQTEIKVKYPKVLQELVMDLLRALSSPNLDIVRKTLDIAMDLASPSNVQEVVALLKKEITKSAAEEYDRGGDRRHLLVQAIHSCATKFPEVAHQTVLPLLDFLSDSNIPSALDVVYFVREVIQSFPDLRSQIFEKILSQIPLISSPKILRPLLWIVSEFTSSGVDIAKAFACLTKESLSPFLPGAAHAGMEGASSLALAASVLLRSHTHPASASSSSSNSDVGANSHSHRPVVLQDGTYASSSALSVASTPTTATKTVISQPLSPLASLFVPSSAHAVAPSVTASAPSTGAPAGAANSNSPDLFLASALASALTKLALRSRHELPDESNKIVAAVSLLLSRLVAVNRSFTASNAVELSASPVIKESEIVRSVDPDSHDWILTCVRLLTRPTPILEEVFLSQFRAAFSSALSVTKAREAAPAASIATQGSLDQSSPDALIRIRQLKPRPMGSLLTAGDVDDNDDSAADAGSDILLNEAAPDSSSASNSLASRLSRIVQLTGLSDSLYAEAIISVHQYDIVLEVTVLNQTQDTLQNLSLELATLGDLKLVERPQVYTIAPFGKLQIKSHVKISSTETGTIFGSIVYDVAGASASDNKSCVVLNEIHIDILDYITPAYCDDASFRAMWQEFGWENKVSVNSAEPSMRDWLNQLVASTNMRCLTPASSLQVDEQCGFLAVNLYAKSKFGEDALANVSIQKASNGKIQGFIRIRSQTQGIAVSLGEKVAHSLK
jgi:coatomer subunit beta